MPNHPGAWAALASLSADLMALLDARGRIVWVNSAFESTSGHGASAVIGRPLAELLAVAGDTTPWPRVGEALAWGRAVERVELPWRHPGGGTRWGALAAQPVDDGPARLAVCLQDLSEPRRLAELVETAQEFGRLGMWERRIPSGEGRWGPQVFRFFGLDPRDGTPPFEAVRERIHPEDRDRVDYDGSTRRPGRYQARYRVLLPDGRVQRIHSQWEVKAAPCGAPERAVGIMVDDTETYQLAQDFNDTTEQLRLAVDLGNIAIWRHDLRTNRLHYNYRAYQVLDIPPRPEGLSLDEVRAVIHPEDLPRAIAAATTALTVDHPVDMEARYRRPDGSWRHVQTRRLLRRDAAGEPLEFVGVALDVTDQVEKSRRVNELAQRLEIAAHAAGLGIFTREADSVRPEWNTEMFRLMGRAPELGVPPVDEWLEHIVHPDDRARMARSRERLLHLRDAASEEQYRVVWPGGEVRWLLNRERRVLRNGRATIFGITIDVTERVRTEAALHGATERVALTARSVGLGTWEWDPDADVSVWDEQMFRLRGRQPRAQAPDADERLHMVHHEDRGRVETLLARAVAQHRSAAYEYRVVWPDGAVHWLATRATPVAGAKGDTRYIGVDWDITDSVVAEEERRERLVAQRESEAKSQFLARMSHELRTPLNAVLGFAQLLQHDAGGASDEQRSRIRHILAAGEHLLSLINDVLDLSSLESGQLRLEMKPVPLADVAAEAMPLVQPLARKFGVALRAGPLGGTVSGDRTRVRQILINLLSNAVKYNRPGGEARVETALHEGTVALRVVDTGRGLTEEQRAHLFEPFNRLGIDRQGIEGTGIGLAIVKTLATRMGGTIAVHSTPGQGSTFEVLLLRADPAEPDAQRSPGAPAAPARAARGQLLYIEDNPINVMLVEELVSSRSGLGIVSEPNGELGVARARALRPDIVLVDMQLPDFDGFEVLRRLKAMPETSHIPCLAVSANAMPEDIRRALEAGFLEYWTKPIDFTAFLQSIETLLAAR